MERNVSKPRNDWEIMTPSSRQSKRRKTDQTPSRRILPSAAVERGVSASTEGSTFPVASGSEFRIQQAKRDAVAEAKQDGWNEPFETEKFGAGFDASSKETWPCLTEQPFCPKRKITVLRTCVV